MFTVLDVWRLYRGRAQQLSESLAYVERTLIAVSQSSMGNMLRTSSIVQNIVSESAASLGVARTAHDVSTVNLSISTTRINIIYEYYYNDHFVIFLCNI